MDDREGTGHIFASDDEIGGWLLAESGPPESALRHLGACQDCDRGWKEALNRLAEREPFVVRLQDRTRRLRASGDVETLLRLAILSDPRFPRPFRPAVAAAAGRPGILDSIRRELRGQVGVRSVRTRDGTSWIPVLPSGEPAPIDLAALDVRMDGNQARFSMVLMGSWNLDGYGVGIRPASDADLPCVPAVFCGDATPLQALNRRFAAAAASGPADRRVPVAVFEGCEVPAEWQGIDLRSSEWELILSEPEPLGT